MQGHCNGQYDYLKHFSPWIKKIENLNYKKNAQKTFSFKEQILWKLPKTCLIPRCQGHREASCPCGFRISLRNQNHIRTYFSIWPHQDGLESGKIIHSPLSGTHSFWLSPVELSLICLNMLYFTLFNCVLNYMFTFVLFVQTFHASHGPDELHYIYNPAQNLAYLRHITLR